MIRPPDEMGVFQFAVIAGLRVAQLTRGCAPRVQGGYSRIVTAQREVAEGKISALPRKAKDDSGPLHDA